MARRERRQQARSGRKQTESQVAAGAVRRRRLSPLGAITVGVLVTVVVIAARDWRERLEIAAERPGDRSGAFCGPYAAPRAGNRREQPSATPGFARIYRPRWRIFKVLDL
jgi:hypothetical protein